MRVTFLGTGAAGGVPLYGCPCAACERARAQPEHGRRPCSALIESGDTRILIDAGLTDLHERFPPGSLSAIVLTHYHPDHVQGLFHLRWGKGVPISVFGPPDSQGCADLYKSPGLLRFQPQSKFEPFTVGTMQFTPLPLIHSKVTFGYAIEDSVGCRFAWLTDTLGLPPRTESFLKDWQADGLALDCTDPPRETPKNHNDWNAAQDVIAATAPKRAWMTHIGHALDAWRMQNAMALPEGIEVAADGEVIDLAGKGPL